MEDSDPLSMLPEEMADDIHTFYDLLEVDHRASMEEIKKAYREQTQTYHPDKSEHDHAEDIFVVINQAKDVLLNQNERIMYNELGHQAYFNQQMVSNDSSLDVQDDYSEEYDSSVYDLIKMAKIANHTREPWWKTIINSVGFWIAVGSTLLLILLSMVLFTV